MQTIEPPDPQTPRKFFAVAGWLKLVLGLALLLLVIRFAGRIGWGALAERIQGADVLLLGATVLLLVVRVLSWHLRWSLSLRAMGERISPLRLFTVLQASILANHVLPSLRLAGGLLRARYVAMGGKLSFEQAYGTILFDVALHQVVTTLFTWATVIGASWHLGYRTLSVAAATVGAALGLYVARRLRRSDPLDGILARYLRRRMERDSGRVSRLLWRGRETVDVVRRLAGMKALRWQVPAYGLIWLLATILSQWTAFRSIGIEIGFAAAAAAVGLGMLATALTGTPGGIGSVEAAMVASYMLFGLPEVDAMAGTLLYRGVHYAVVMGLGLPSLAYCEIVRPRPESDPVEAR